MVPFGFHVFAASGLANGFWPIYRLNFIIRPQMGGINF